jgi:hypothetical protein
MCAQAEHCKTDCVSMNTVIEMATAAPADDTIAGIDESTFYIVLTVSLIACAILTPLSIFGLRKWCAYRDLLKQYDQLRNQSNDFPETEMDTPRGGIDITGTSTYDEPHTGIIPEHQERATGNL